MKDANSAPRRVGHSRHGDRAALLTVVVGVSACGSTVTQEAASPRTFRLDWHDQDAGLAYSVTSIRIGERGRRVFGSISNVSPTAYVVTRVHHPGEVTFALLASRSPRMPRSGNFRDLRTPFPATATRPRVRNVLLPGEGWRGTFSGVGRLPRGAYLRVLFGLFAPPGEPGKRFAVVTTRWVRLP